jgi:hypothetical protein
MPLFNDRGQDAAIYTIAGKMPLFIRSRARCRYLYDCGQDAAIYTIAGKMPAPQIRIFTNSGCSLLLPSSFFFLLPSSFRG